jgi:anaerobic selenocysteine-containing dehydrogenase
MTEIRRTTCNRDCPDACSILVTIDRDRAARLQGDPDDPVTRGFLCYRTSRFLSRQYTPDRITTPLVRRNGKLVSASWDEALGLVTEKLTHFRDESGSASILHYRSGGSLGILKAVADYFFETFGPVTIKRGDICSGAGEAAQERDFGIADSSDLDDLLASKLIINWGKNPHTSGVHLLPILREATSRGTRLVTIDVVRTKSAARSDRYLAPRPGGDFFLAMGIARCLFENDWVDPRVDEYAENLQSYRDLVFSRSVEEWAGMADVPVNELVDLARLYGTTKPAAILVGWGMARRRYGAATVRALDALGIVSGNVGVSGGGVSYYFARRQPFDLDFLRGPEVAPRTLSEPRLGEEILAAKEPPIRMIWVTAGNPVAMLPDSTTVAEAFRRSEFNVVVDTHPTDTTDLAHLVLPTRTLLEDDDVMGAYGNHYVRASRPAIPAPGDVRHEVDIFRDLSKRCGLNGPLSKDVEAWKRYVTRGLSAKGVSLERLRETALRNPSAPRVIFADKRFPTPSGKARLIAEAVPVPEPMPESYPLTLMAISTPKAQSSQWAGPAPEGPPEVRVHPDVTGGFSDGDIAHLESRQGQLKVRIVQDTSVRKDVAMMEKGGMLRDGRAANLLIPAVETDDGGGAAYYDEPVRLVE